MEAAEVSAGASARIHPRLPSITWQFAANGAVWIAVLLLNLLQQPGRTTFDTKLDLQLNAWGFLSRSTSLWNADWALGGLQNQASGYLFPMGPVFLIGEWLHVPVWVWERLWSALVMLLAYEGVRRLARAWPGITSWGAVVAGLCYMLAPRVLTTVGGLSGETLPGAVLPWTLLPLVLHLRGRLGAPAAFVLSAATVTVMGGQNATLVVACLLLPALLLALAPGRSILRRARDLIVWGALVAAATAWWVVPLLLLGAYAPPFLDFIESANSTAGQTGWLSSLRGTNHWVAFFPGGGRLGWTGGHDLASSGWLMVATAAVAGVGLIGLMQRGLWLRRVLAVSMVLGLAILTAGSGGWAGSLLSEQWLHALDTTLAPLRNVHKFDPLVRIPLALGLGAWIGRPLSIPWRTTLVDLWRAGTAVAVTALVVAAAAPAMSGSLRTDDGFDGLPDSWREAVAYLQEQPTATRSLILPGGTFAVQEWGRTIDEPIQVLDAAPWISRPQSAVASAGTVRVLESIELLASRNRPQDEIAVALQGLGVTHVVVRHDLDASETDAADSDSLRATLVSTPGVRLAAAFGDRASGDSDIEVFKVATDGDPRIDLTDWSARAVVDGAPEVVPTLRADGVIADDQPVVLARDDERGDVVTDSLRRTERGFGRSFASTSGVMADGDPYRIDRLGHDYVDDTMPSGRTTADYDGVSQITASSSMGYADIFGPVRPEAQPYSAFDDSLFTNWVSAPYTEPENQWIEVRFDDPTRVEHVSMTFDNAGGASIRAVRVTTDHGEQVVDVSATGVAQDVELGGEPTTTLRISIEDVTGDTRQVRLSDVRLEDHHIRRSLVVPGDLDTRSSLFLQSEAPQRACAVGAEGLVTCEAARFRDTSESGGFRRTVDVVGGGTWTVRGQALATHGSALDRLFEPLDPDRVSVVATSTLGGDPAVNAAGAMDGRRDTSWASSPGDDDAALQLRWGPKRTITSVEATLADGAVGRLPRAFLVDGGPGTGRPQRVRMTGPRAGRMRPITTDQLRLTTLGGSADGVGVSELDVTGIEDLRNEPDPDDPTGTACGYGPRVEVSGRVVVTRLTGTLRDIREGGALDVVACGKPLRLDYGSRLIEVTNPYGFTTTSLTLTPPGEPSVSSQVAPRVLRWTGPERDVGVSARGESVLGVRESYNHGWAATLDGQELEAVILDGWRQGFVLPAGSSGTVELRFGPQRIFEVSVVGGLALAGLLMLAGIVIAWRRPWRRTTPYDVEPATEGVVRPAVWVLAVIVLTVVSVPLALGVLAARFAGRLSELAMSAVCVGGVVAAGLLAVASSSVIVPPALSHAMVAVVVGLVVGRLLVSETPGSGVRIHPEPLRRLG